MSKETEVVTLEEAQASARSVFAVTVEQERDALRLEVERLRTTLQGLVVAVKTPVGLQEKDALRLKVERLRTALRGLVVAVKTPVGLHVEGPRKQEHVELLKSALVVAEASLLPSVTEPDEPVEAAERVVWIASATGHDDLCSYVDALTRGISYVYNTRDGAIKAMKVGPDGKCFCGCGNTPEVARLHVTVFRESKSKP